MLASAAAAEWIAVLTKDLRNGAWLFGLEIGAPFSPDGLSPRAVERLGAP